MVNNPKDDNPSGDLFEFKSVRVSLFIVIPIIIFVLVCAGIRVSQYGIDHTILVFSQKTLVSGWPAALRISLVTDDGMFFLPTRLTGSLVRGSERYPLFDGAVQDQGYALARNYQMPKMAPGPADLELKVYFDDKRRIIRNQVEVTKEPPKETLTVPSDTDLLQRPSEVMKEGDLLQVFSGDRGLPTGLTSVAFVRAQKDNGAPVSTGLSLIFPGRTDASIEPKTVRTDRLGLKALPIKPLELAYPIKVPGSRLMQAKEALKDGGIQIEETDAFLQPRIVYAGITAAVHNPIVELGDRVRVSASQISQGGPVYADLFYKGRWIQAISSSFAGKKTSFEIHPQLTGICRVQITTSALMHGRTVAVRHFYTLGKGEDVTAGLRKILKRLESSEFDRNWARAVLAMPLERGSGYDRRLAAAFALSRLYQGHQAIPLLRSSRIEDDAELSAFKTRFQRMIMLAILLLGFGVASLIALIAFQSHRRQQRISMMIMEESGQEEGPLDSWHTDMGRRPTRNTALLQGAVLFIIILAAFASIALLIDTLTWYR